MNKNEQSISSPNRLRKLASRGRELGAVMTAATVGFSGVPGALASHESSVASDAPDAPLIQAGHNSLEGPPRLKDLGPVYARYTHVVNEVVAGERPGGFVNCAVAVFAPSAPHKEADMNRDFDNNYNIVYTFVKPGYVRVITVPMLIKDGVLPEDPVKTPDTKIVFSAGLPASGQTDANGNPQLMVNFSLNRMKQQGAKVECFPYQRASMKTQIVKAERHGDYLMPPGFHTYNAAGYVMHSTEIPRAQLNGFLKGNGFQTKPVALPQP